MQPLLILEHFYYPQRKHIPAKQSCVIDIHAHPNPCQSIIYFVSRSLPILDISLESTIEYMTKTISDFHLT